MIDAGHNPELPAQGYTESRRFIWSDKFPYGLADGPIDRKDLAKAFSRDLVVPTQTSVGPCRRHGHSGPDRARMGSRVRHPVAS